MFKTFKATYNFVINRTALRYLCYEYKHFSW